MASVEAIERRTALAEKVRRVREVTSRSDRLGVSEFARSREWRDRLADQGCMEIVDRQDTVGYVMSPEHARALTDYIADLEEELENEYLHDLFRLRPEETAEYLSGEELRKQTDAYFDEHADEIMEFINNARR